MQPKTIEEQLTGKLKEMPDKGEGEPQILLEPIYDDKDPLKVVGHRTMNLVPGTVIKRCGKRYLVTAKGTQIRIKEKSEK